MIFYVDKYYLCDAAYPYTRGFMTLYRNAQHCLPDFRNGVRPRTKEETFNYAHARLRNVIERSFVVLKARFPILKRMTPYPFQVLRNIVIACVAIHNYIRKLSIADTFLEQGENEYGDNLGMPQNNHEGLLQVGGRAAQADKIFMINLREEITNQLIAH